MNEKPNVVKKPTQLREVLEDMLVGLEVYQNLKTVERELEIKEQKLVEIGNLEEKRKALRGEMEGAQSRRDGLVAEATDIQKNVERAEKDARAIVAEAENVRAEADKYFESKKAEVEDEHKILDARKNALYKSEKAFLERKSAIDLRESDLEKREGEFNRSLKSLLSVEKEAQ